MAVGLEAPVYATSPLADGRLFVVEQPGRIRVIRDGQLVSSPFLDITDRVLYEGEQGLLGLVFDPDFRATGRFFVYYTDLDGNTRVEGYRDIDQGDRADPNSAELYLSVAQPFPNHNGGQLAFGRDRMLYIGLGDGGGGGDPRGNGQNTQTLLGSILRVDVVSDFSPPYRIPPDNPFVGSLTHAPEIWHYGLRNPWRFSFQPNGRGYLYVADVGQDRWEEINAVPIKASGLNFGWNVMEGAECFGGGGCEADGLTFPVAVYGHADGCSVTGGFEYRGLLIPALSGRYVYSDYCAGWIRTFRLDNNGGATDPVELEVDPLGGITSFGEDARGELYVTTTDGRVLRLEPRS